MVANLISELTKDLMESVTNTSTNFQNASC